MTEARPQTLLDVKEDILRAAGWMIAGIVLAAILGIVFIVLATPHYKAQMLVAPATPMTGAGGATLTGNDSLSGLRDLLQRGVFNGSADFLRFENMVSGPSVAVKLLQDEKIRRGLAMDGNFGASDETRDWTPEELADYLEARVTLQPVGSTAMRRMIYLHPSREFGVYLLHSLHRITDEMIRGKVREEATARINYLQQESYKTDNPDHRRALTALLLDEERLLMLASIDQPYAAAIIEPPSAGVRTVWPDAMMIMPVMMFAGALCGFLLHGVFSAHSRRKEEAFSIEEKGWFRAESSNINRRPLTGKRRRTDAAE